MLSIALVVIAVLFLAPPLLFLVCLKVAPSLAIAVGR